MTVGFCGAAALARFAGAAFVRCASADEAVMLAPITQIAVRTLRPFIFSPSFAGDTIPIKVEAFQASTVVVYDCHGQRHIGLPFFLSVLGWERCRHVCHTVPVS